MESNEAAQNPPAPPLVLELFAQGRGHLRLYDVEGYQEAVIALLKAIRVDPDFSPAHGALAEAYAHWGHRREISGEEAESYYALSRESAAAAVKLGPGLAHTHRALACSLAHGARRDPAGRLAAANRALELDPEDGENCYVAWRARGYRLDDPLIRRALALCPAHCGARNDLGVSLHEGERLEDAALEFRAALEINPRNTLVMANLAMTLWRLSDPIGALRLLRHGDALRPEDPLLRKCLDIFRKEEARLMSSP